MRGQRFYQRPEVREARRLIERAHLTETGTALLDAVRDLFAKRLGYDAAVEATGDEAEERAASLELLLTIAADLVAATPTAGAADLLAELDRRDAAEADAQGVGVNLSPITRPRALSGTRSSCPPRRGHAAHPPGQDRRAGGRGAPAALRRHHPRSNAPGAFVVAQAVALPRRDPPAPRHPIRDANRVPSTAGDDLLAALKEWRTNRAKQDAVPPYVVSHDSTLAAIAEDRPQSITQLRRVKGMGPVKLDSYGAEILAIVARDSR